MKFTVTPSAAGGYITKAGSTVAIVPSAYGAAFTNEAAFAAAHALTPRALYAARETKLASLARAADAPVAVGLLHISSDEATIAKFTGLATLLQLARDAQPDDAHRAAFLATPLSAVAGPIIAADGSAHDMTVAQAFTLVLGYGQAIGAARATLLSRQAAVAAAGSVQAVEAV
jgi:hypothetical protein